YSVIGLKSRRKYFSDRCAQAGYGVARKRKQESPLDCTVPKTLLRAASCHVLFCRTATGGTPMPSFTWDHVHLRTPDPEGTAQSFERMVGAEVIRSTQQGKPRIDIRLGGAMIFTAQVNPGDGVNPPPTTPYQGLDHFGFAVSGIDDIAAELKKKGVE